MDAWLAGALLAFPLTWAAVVDLDRYILPDAITLPLIGIGLAIAGASGWWILLDHVIGAAADYAFLALAAFGYRRARDRDGLGLGDAKLFAAGGAWLGWTVLPATLLVASAATLTFVAARWASGRPIPIDRRIAFGPFLAGATWLGWLWVN
jgi:leader peptidase (prepilin peptidase)/N-methyltransferase